MRIAGEPYDREHQEDGEQEKCDRRDEPRPLAFDVAAGQLPRLPDEQRKRVPDLAFEMEDAVGEVMEEGGQRAVDMRPLAAVKAILAGELGPAIEAIPFMRMTVGLPRARLDGAADHAARDRVANCFEIAHPLAPSELKLAGARPSC
jgi:hypothetical protein